MKYVCVCVSMYTHNCADMYARMYACAYTYVYVHLCMHACMYVVCIHVHVRMYACMFHEDMCVLFVYMYAWICMD